MPHYCDRVFLYETKKDGGAGMIVGEFEPAYLVPTMEISPDEMSNSVVAQTCLSRIELEAYAGAPYKKLRLLKVEKATKYEKPVQLKRPGPQSWTYAREWEVKQIDRENH
jgi:predicted transcriptional regulator